VEKSNLNSEDTSTFFSSPKDFGWHWPVFIKQIGELYFGVDQQDGFMIYGLFKTNKCYPEDCISACEIKYKKGNGEIFKDGSVIPFVEMVCTEKNERSKGYGLQLYEAMIERHGVLVSGDTLFTELGKFNLSLGLWKNHISNKGSLTLYNAKLESFDHCDINQLANADMRFIIIKDFSVLSEKVRNTAKFGSAALIMALAVMMPPTIGGNESTLVENKIFSIPIRQVAPSLPIVRPPAITPKPAFVIPKTIDVKIIGTIESKNDHSAHNEGTDARGKFQLRAGAWEDAIKGLKKDYDFDDWNHIKNNSEEICKYYFNTRIPEMLKAYKTPITYETVLGAYNWGPAKVANAWKRYGSAWIRKAAPQETKDYIDSYRNMIRDKNK